MIFQLNDTYTSQHDLFCEFSLQHISLFLCSNTPSSPHNIFDTIITGNAIEIYNNIYMHIGKVQKIQSLQNDLIKQAVNILSYK